MMKNLQKKSEDVQIQALCHKHQNCCTDFLCRATFIPISGSDYEFYKCGCDGSVIT
nr:hypothetical protein [Brevibacillus laterosporus]